MLYQHQQYLLTCLASGLTTHLIFRHYEPSTVRAHAVLLVAVPFCLVVFCYIRWSSNPLSTIGLHFGTLVTSILTYRLSSFHPLASIPGPKVLRISRSWSSKIDSDSYQHLYYHDLLQKHGSFVRIGPNHVLTTEASAIPIVLSAKPFRKSDRYSTLLPLKDTAAILGITDPHEHADRRRLWDKGMNSQAINNYKGLMDSRLQELLSLLSQQQDKDLNLSTWLSFYSFDIMGDLAFNGRYNFMENKNKKEAEYVLHLKNMRKALFVQDCIMLVPWLRPYVYHVIPRYLMDQAMWLRDFAKPAMLDRMKGGTKIKDFFYHILDEDNTGAKRFTLPTLVREAALIIPAGYDSTATALCHTFFNLLSNPKYLRKLQDEIDETFGNAEEVYTDEELHKLPYLNAVINETLRLSPALPGGSHRYLPKGSTNGAGGIMLADTWIPEETHIQIHTYSMHRNPKYFSPEPESFRPERWLEKGYTTDHSAFIPFSYGPANCIGKQIALVKLRKTICALIKTFDFELSPRFHVEMWNKGVTEQFTLGRGDLIARLRKRS